MMALALVSAGVIGAAHLDADRTGIDDRLNPVDEARAVLPFVVVGIAGVAAGAIAYDLAQQYLGGQGYTEEQVDRMLAGEAAQQEVDLTVGMTSQEASAEQYLTAVNNHRQDSRAVASMKAKARLAELINNGTTDVATLSQEVNETIEDYYSRQQVNLENRWTTHVSQLNYTYHAGENDVDITRTSIIHTDSETANSDPVTKMVLVNVSVTLVNGSTTTGTRHSYYYSSSAMWLNNTVAELDSQVSPSSSDVGWETGTVGASNDSLKTVRDVQVLYQPNYQNTWEAHETAAQQLKQNYGLSFVEAVVAQYEAGAINTSDLISPEILANEWGTAYNQTGDSTYAWATFAAMGTPIPNLNQTAAMQVSYLKTYETRHIRLNVTNPDGNLSDGTPYYATLAAPNGSNVAKKVIVDENGTTHDVTFPVPTNDGPTVSDYEFYLTSPSGGQIKEWRYGGFDVSFQGVDVKTVQEFNRTVTEWGMLFASDSPSNGWNASGAEPDGKIGPVDPENGTYDAANRGSVYFSVESGGFRLVEKDFTIHRIVNDSGANLTSVDVRSYNKQTADPSNFTEQLRQLSALREEVEVRVEPSGGGIDFGLGGAGGPLLGVLVLFVIGAFVAKVSD